MSQCPTTKKHLFFFVAAVGILSAGAGHASPAITVSANGNSIGRYNVYELTLTGPSASYNNPWDNVKISAVFTGPSGKSTVGGFYYNVNTWKVRFAPEVTGNWTWSLTFTAPNGTYSTKGSFKVTSSSNSGFLRLNSEDSRHFYTEGNMDVFYPIGFNDCIGNIVFATTYPTLMFGMDGTHTVDWGEGQHFTPSNTNLVPMAQYFSTYTSQGLDNYFRAGPGNCAFELYDSANVNGTGQNTYDVGNGQLWDSLVQTLHADGVKFQMEIIADPQDLAPNFDLSNAAVKASVLDYHQYILNRYGAYVDIWELGNEQRGVPQAYLDTITEFFNSNDPYHHPLTVSFDQTQDDTAALSVAAGLHDYFGDPLTLLDADVSNACDAEKTTQNEDKPLIAGEAGNAYPQGNDVPVRYRDMLWTYNMNQCAGIFWNMSATMVIDNTIQGSVSNMYIGPQQRLESKVFSNFISGFDPAAQPLAVNLAPQGQFQGYLLGSNKDIGGYFFNYSNPGSTLSGATVKLHIPTLGMSGQWIDPATGNVLKKFNLSTGTQTLAIPSFTYDIALLIK